MTDLYRKGDKVSATHKKTQEVHEFEVRDNAYGPIYIVTTSGIVLHGAFWDFEKLARPLPTKAGLYQVTTDVSMNKLMLTTHGDWFWLDFTSEKPVARKAKIESIQESYADTITPVYLYGEAS